MSVPFRAAFSETMPLSARSLYTQKYFSPCFPSMYITDQNCPHRRRLTCRFEYLDEMRSFIKLTMFFAILYVRITQSVKMKRVGDLLNSN